MSNDINPQVSSTALTSLKLTPAAFTAALTTAIPPGKIGWTSDNHWGLLESLLPHLKDDTGKPATISHALENVLKLIYQPKEEIEKEVLRQAFADASYILEDAAANILIMMFSTAQFADFLAKNQNPATKQPFIQKDKKRGAKKETFNALLSLSTPADAPASVNEPETDEPTVEAEVAEPAGDAVTEPPAAPPAPAKAVAKR